MQITAGVVSNSWRLGTIPSADNPIQLTGIAYTGTNVAVTWTSGAAQNYSVQYVVRLGDVWQTIASVTGTGALTSFTETNVSRLSQPVGFYRIAQP